MEIQPHVSEEENATPFIVAFGTVPSVTQGPRLVSSLSVREANGQAWLSSDIWASVISGSAYVRFSLGDILLLAFTMTFHYFQGQANAIIDESKRWPNAVVPYKLGNFRKQYDYLENPSKCLLKFGAKGTSLSAGPFLWHPAVLLSPNFWQNECGPRSTCLDFRLPG